MSGESIQRIFQEGEEDEGWIDQDDERREEHSHDEPRGLLSTTSCTPIEEEDFDILEKLDWSSCHLIMEESLLLRREGQ